MQNKFNEKIAILADSACNVVENEDNNIFVVPLYVIFKNYSKMDLVEVTPDEIYSKIDTDAPTTSAPSVEDFSEKISYIKKLGYTHIIGISITTSFSGTYNSMRLALEKSNINYEVLDSRSVSVGSGLLIEYGSRLIKKCLEFKKIYETIKNKRKDIKFYAIVNDLKYLIRGGRISNLKGIIGTILKITPILSIGEDGTVSNHKSVRGKDRALKYMSKLVKRDLEESDNYFMALSYAEDIDGISDIKTELKNYIEKADFYYQVPLTSVLGAHAGPSTYVVSYMSI